MIVLVDKVTGDIATATQCRKQHGQQLREEIVQLGDIGITFYHEPLETLVEIDIVPPPPKFVGDPQKGDTEEEKRGYHTPKAIFTKDTLEEIRDIFTDDELADVIA
ncbi:hypothetical protein ACJMK2_035817 [Sinanodonta woodiana]|uniref:Uncharacterized protein n=1 Tax=Sinanodonta woodiana TaxID=1069815 RepID=A0ABD3WIQ0_SINWO